MNAKLTAYALNELPPDERAALEAEMETNPALRAEAEEMRTFCTMIHDEVADADKAVLTTEQRFRVLREFSTDSQPQAQSQPQSQPQSRPKRTTPSIWRHPAFLVPTAIAACTTVMLVINLKDKQDAPTTAEVEQIVERRLAERMKDRPSSEDVRVNIEKNVKLVVAGQTPAPGKPEMPSLVAAGSAITLNDDPHDLIPMPTAGGVPASPASPVLLAPLSLDSAPIPPLVVENAGRARETIVSSDFSGLATLDTIADPSQGAMRGVEISTGRPLERYQMPTEAFADIPTAPKAGTGSVTVTAGNTYHLAEAAEVAPRAAGIASSPVANSAPSARGAELAFGVDSRAPSLVGPAMPSGSYSNMADAYFLNGASSTLGKAVGPEESVLGGGVQTPYMLTEADAPVVGQLFRSTEGLSKSGDGTLALAPSSPANTFTGGTSISSGALALDGAAPKGQLTVNGSVTTATSAALAPAAQKPAEPLDKLNRGWQDLNQPTVIDINGGTKASEGRYLADATPEAQVSVNFGGAALTTTPPPAGQPQPPMPVSGPAPAAAAQPAATERLAAVAESMTVADPAAVAAPAAAAAPVPATAAGRPMLAATPAASPATLPPGVEPFQDGFALGIFGAGIIPAESPADPMAGAAGAPGATPTSPPADANAIRLQGGNLVTTTEFLARAEREVEKFKEEGRAKDLKQIRDLQEAETRSLALVTRNPRGETYTPIYENPFLQVAQQPLSTFSIDVDTASYANVRRFLNSGQRPPADAVRLEELINYFPYTYEPPAEDGAPFSVTVDIAEAPWQPMHRLARIALKGRDVRKERGAANFVFLVDVSGSMDSPDKLPLVKQSLRMLTEQLKDTDRVAIVTYAGESGIALTSTPGSERQKIQSAIEALSAGGSTNGAGGIRMAYQQASQNFIPEGVNRVILCTDGDFNVGISSPEELEKLIAEKAKSRVFLSVLGYGTGNLKDRTMETLADKGNGNYAYIDSLSEARKVLVDQMNATLVTIAKDVKIQVEFNPAQVAAYRLLGYENRALAKEDFNNDRKDAGEIGAGHTVTALYEIVPVGARLTSTDGRPAVDELKYAPKPPPVITTTTPAPVAGGGSGSKETMTVKLRYKQPEGDKSQLIEVPVTDKGQTLGDAPQDFVFAAGVTGFGMLLRNSQYSGELTWDMVRGLALHGKGADTFGYRGEFLQLIDKARGLMEGRE